MSLFLTVSNSHFPYISHSIVFIESPILHRIEKSIIIVKERDLYRRLPKNVNLWCLNCRLYEISEIGKLHEEVFFTEEEEEYNNIKFGLELELEPLDSNFNKLRKSRVKILEEFGVNVDEMFNSKIGLDGNLSVFELRSDPKDNVSSAVEDILNSLQKFYQFINSKEINLSFGIYNSCGLHINIDYSKNWQFIKPILDLSVYSYIRKLNPFVRDYMGYSRPSYRRKSFGWEYRSFPATTIAIPEVISFTQEIIKRFINGDKFVLGIDDYGVGWIINHNDLFSKQEEIHNKVNELFLDIVENENKILDVNGVKIHVDLNEINPVLLD